MQEYVEGAHRVSCRGVRGTIKVTVEPAATGVTVTLSNSLELRRRGSGGWAFVCPRGYQEPQPLGTYDGINVGGNVTIIANGPRSIAAGHISGNVVMGKDGPIIESAPVEGVNLTAEGNVTIVAPHEVDINFTNCVGTLIRDGNEMPLNGDYNFAT